MKIPLVARRLAGPLAALLAAGLVPGLLHDDGSRVCFGSKGEVVCVPPEPVPGPG